MPNLHMQRYSAYLTDFKTHLEKLFIYGACRLSLVLKILIDITSENDSFIHFKPKFQFSTLFEDIVI